MSRHFHVSIQLQFIIFLIFISYNLYGINLDRAYIFKVDRAVNHPKVAVPGDTIPENQYKATDAIILYKIRFSTDRDSIYINEDQITGYKHRGSKDTIMYLINLFPSGRFIVYNAEPQLQAELTKYGSGIPIIRSERGQMVKDNVFINLRRNNKFIPDPSLKYTIQNPKLSPEYYFSITGRSIKKTNYFKSPQILLKKENSSIKMPLDFNFPFVGD